MQDSQGTENVEICLIAGYFHCLDLSLQKIRQHVSVTIMAPIHGSPWQPRAVK